MQRFGGSWTEDKLGRLRAYLHEYAKIMSRQSFQFAYIDAFAGTGYRESANAEEPQPFLFEEILDHQSLQFLDGSARIALQIEPSFDKYILIERDTKRIGELEKLKSEFPNQKSRIEIVPEDCNSYLQRICTQSNWRRHRAVVFLDPFGMNVSWSTITALADTGAIDLWYLFPLGVGVNRLLRKDARVPETWRAKLTNLFGDDTWQGRFYVDDSQSDLFVESATRKVADFGAIRDFLLEKLRSVFPGVADNPLYLYNSVNNPLYLFCFACANERGAPIAVRIAKHILNP